jgi:hypothetical protein
MNFFAVTIDKLNSNWLSNVLDKSSHTIGNEGADPADPDIMQPFSDFPLERFCKANYGEVHCSLRHQLSAGVQGVDRLIDRRAMILANVKDVIRERMNRDGRTIDELSAVIFEASTEQRLLKEWAKSDPEVRVFNFEAMTTTLGVLSDFCSWLKLDYVPTEMDLEDAVARQDKAIGWFDWDEKSNDLYEIITSRQTGSHNE